jgi:hypothetical protein
MKSVHPEVLCSADEGHLICEKSIRDSHPNTHVVGWDLRDFLKHHSRQKIE